jgi:hypothetical protein
VGVVVAAVVGVAVEWVGRRMVVMVAAVVVVAEVVVTVVFAVGVVVGCQRGSVLSAAMFSTHSFFRVGHTHSLFRLDASPADMAQRKRSVARPAKGSTRPTASWDRTHHSPSTVTPWQLRASSYASQARSHMVSVHLFLVE